MLKPDKRAKILSAALELITAHGFHGAPMAMISARASVATGTIYCYFSGRDALIMALYQEIEKNLLAGLMDGDAFEYPIQKRFLFFYGRLIRYFMEHSLEFRYVEQFHNSPYGANYRRNKMLSGPGEKDLFARLFKQGIADGTIKSLPLQVLFALAFGPMFSILREHVLGFIELDDKLMDDIALSSWDSITSHVSSVAIDTASLDVF